MDDANEVLALNVVYQQILCESLRVTCCDYVITAAAEAGLRYLYVGIFVSHAHCLHHVSDNMCTPHGLLYRQLFICQ